MKALRSIILVCFLITSAIFGYYEFREIRDRDNEAPVITSDSDELQVSVNVTREELLAGLKAVDNRDGDVTDSIVMVSSSYFISGTTVKMTYAAFDSHNNVGKYTRKVTYTDYQSPRFSLSQPLVFTSRSNPDYLANVSAYDVLDGDISSKITLIAQDSTYTDSDTRTIPMIFQVTNRVGDTAEVYVYADQVTQETYNRPAPALKEYIIYTSPGQTPDYRSYIKGIRRAGTTRDFDETFTEANISVDSSRVDVYTPGSYNVTYFLTDNEGEVMGSTYLYVVVTEEGQ